MSSDDRGREPRDLRRPPTQSNAGRAGAGPAPSERRPRGRPRKDASAPRAPPARTPTPKPRKKGRSRGRAQAAEKEEVDGTENTQTGIKEPVPKAEEETTPTPLSNSKDDRSSPNPSPSPSPTVIPSPVPVPDIRSSPNPGEERLIPGPNPDLNPSPRPSPVPSPVPSPMEDRLSPNPNPSANPSPNLSPCPSPCSRLMFSPRDDGSFSPLFQRSVSEDSAGSSASALGHAKIRVKLCAFCYCGEGSILGQGELKVFGPTPGYVPLHIRNRRGSSEKDDDYHDDDYYQDDRSPGQRGRGFAKVSSPDSGLHSSSAPGSTDPLSGEQPVCTVWEELGQIGLPHDINVQSLFDPTGQCCAHLQCAAWSDGVCRGEGQSLLYVDKAIDSGSTECCAYCKRLGASIKCSEGSCSRSYHFPCAAASGTFQDAALRSLLCPDHLQLATHTFKSSVVCEVCSSAGELQDLLLCSSCGQHYHGSCLNLAPTPLRRPGWQCPPCKVCLTCRTRGEDGQMLVCEQCDKGYHTFCLEPVMDHIPSNGWRCKNCRVCSQCAVRVSGQWANHPSLCEVCRPTLPCPICGRAPDTNNPHDYLTCHTCKRWLHTECVKQGGGEESDRPSQDGYVCSLCTRLELETDMEISQSHHSPSDTGLSLPSPSQTQTSSVHASCSQASPTRASSIHPSPTHDSPSHPSPIHASPTHASSCQASPIHASQTLASPTHAKSSHASPIHISSMPASPCPTHMQNSPMHTLASPMATSPVHAGVTSPTCVSPPHASPMDTSSIHDSFTHVSPSHASPTHASPTSPTPSPALTLASPMHTQASPVHASHNNSSCSHSSPPHASHNHLSPNPASPTHFSSSHASPSHAVIIHSCPSPTQPQPCPMQDSNPTSPIPSPIQTESSTTFTLDILVPASSSPSPPSPRPSSPSPNETQISPIHTQASPIQVQDDPSSHSPSTIQTWAGTNSAPCSHTPTSTPTSPAHIQTTSTPASPAQIQATSTPTSPAQIQPTSTPASPAQIQPTSTPASPAQIQATSTPTSPAQIQPTSTPASPAQIQATSTPASPAPTSTPTSPAHIQPTTTPASPAHIQATSTPASPVQNQATSTPASPVLIQPTSTPASPIHEATDPEPEPTMDVFMAVVEPEREEEMNEEEEKEEVQLKEEEEVLQLQEVEMQQQEVEMQQQQEEEEMEVLPEQETEREMKEVLREEEAHLVEEDQTAAEHQTEVQMEEEEEHHEEQEEQTEEVLLMEEEKEDVRPVKEHQREEAQQQQREVPEQKEEVLLVEEQKEEVQIVEEHQQEEASQQQGEAQEQNGEVLLAEEQEQKEEVLLAEEQEQMEEVLLAELQEQKEEVQMAEDHHQEEAQQEQEQNEEVLLVEGQREEVLLVEEQEQKEEVLLLEEEKEEVQMVEEQELNEEVLLMEEQKEEELSVGEQEQNEEVLSVEEQKEEVLSVEEQDQNEEVQMVEEHQPEETQQQPPKEGVDQEPEVCASPPEKEEQEDKMSPSGPGSAQEIQVTVTLTQGPESSATAASPDPSSACPPASPLHPDESPLSPKNAPLDSPALPQASPLSPQDTPPSPKNSPRDSPLPPQASPLSPQDTPLSPKNSPRDSPAPPQASPLSPQDTPLSPKNSPRDSPAPPQASPLSHQASPLSPQASPQASPIPPQASPLSPQASPLSPQASPLSPQTSPLSPQTSPLSPQTSPLPPLPSPLSAEASPLLDSPPETGPQALTSPLSPKDYLLPSQKSLLTESAARTGSPPLSSPQGSPLALRQPPSPAPPAPPSHLAAAQDSPLSSSPRRNSPRPSPDDSPLPSRSPVALTEDHQEEETAEQDAEPGERAAPPVPAEPLPSDAEESQSEGPKPGVASPTKETISHEPLGNKEEVEPPTEEEEEPMDIADGEPSPSEPDVPQENVEENVLEPMGELLGEAEEREEAKSEEEEEKEVLKEEKQQEEILDVFEKGEAAPSALSDTEDILGAPDLSPTADQDTAVDMEMDTMDTTPASHLSLSEPGSPRGRGLASDPRRGCWSPLRLTQSPFSTEASPREPTPSPTRDASPPRREVTPTRAQSQIQPQAQAQAQAQSGYPTTVIPLTPKIGMGKPAISKRRFSPGRPRVKQGACWSPRRAGSPPSWPQQLEQQPGEGGWDRDSPRTRPPLEASVWSMRVGRGSGFPGRRRPRGANLSGRGGRGRSRLKADPNLAVTPGALMTEQPYVMKEEEESSMHNTVVMFSTSDHFTLRQDMCVVCGSFGQGAEGRLLACCQCGQCYHPFCVNIKITRVVLNKGWRCLECTVCEACGEASDPGRLLLCDDCDISYHTYCLDPPLHTVPKGSWKCKWCVSCTQCGATSPGQGCEWLNNYTRCGPCASLELCPLCVRGYREDELILQCRLCDRWVHASCQGLNTDEEVEIAADDGFDCSLCRATCLPSHGKVAGMLMEGKDPPIMAQIVSRMREPEHQKTYTQDGVCLTETGLCQLQGLSVSSQRRRRSKPKLKLKIINQNSVSVLQTPPDPHSELSRDGDLDDCRELDLMDCDAKSDSSPERARADNDAKGEEVANGNKKRKRKPYRPGIGGFMVRQRGKTGQGKAKRSLSRKDSTGSLTENPLVKEEGWREAEDVPMEEPAPVPPEGMEKVKKRYRKQKTKLEEAFPSYLQEAFFGKELLDKSKQRRKSGSEPAGLCEEPSGPRFETKQLAASARFLDPSSDPLLSSATPAPKTGGGLPHSEDPLVDLSEVLSSDADLLGMLSEELVKPGSDSGLDLGPFQVDSSPSVFAGLDIVPITDDPSLTSAPSAGRRGPRAVQEEPLDAILSPELDKMVTDGAILSKLYKIPELEGKDVEDLFTAVLSPSTSQPPQPTHHPQSGHPAGANGPRGLPMPHPGDGGMFPRMPMMNGMMGPNSHFPANPRMPGGGNFSPIHRMPFPENARDRKLSQTGSDPAIGPWSGSGPGGAAAAGPPPEAEPDTMSNAQRSTLKWEKEETLGEMATVAPVLYTNVNFPALREQYPDWSTRVKQIAKMWRKASSQDRAPYVQKARDNRAALRINKVQMSNDGLKRHGQQTTPEPFDPNDSIETDLLFKDPLKPKESEHEQEWKFRQGELNQMWGPGKARQEKLVPKSKAIKSTNKDVLFGHSNQSSIDAGGGKMSLQMRQKSKQQAKIEATQKLEQVKSEQQQQRQQQQQQLLSGQSGGDSGDSGGDRSPLTPQSSSGNASPLQPLTSKDGFARPHLPGTPTSGSPDDVFLRPQAPPPSAGSNRIHPHDPSYPQQQQQLPQAQLQLQPQAPPQAQPQSPQMFSPGPSTSRPTSPWDPYGQMVGTPRPPGGSTTPRRNSLSELQERGRPSPAHDTFGSPIPGGPDPYSKPPDTPRPSEPFMKPQGPPRAGPPHLDQQGRPLMNPSLGADLSARLVGVRAEAYQRAPQNRMVLSDPYARPLLTPIPGSNEAGSLPVFKAPMPPHLQTPQDPFGSIAAGMRRGPAEPYNRPPLTPRPMEVFPQAHQGHQVDPYTQRTTSGEGLGKEARGMRQPQEGQFSQGMPGMASPHRNPYAHPLGTPRPPAEGYVQSPGTPRPHSDPSYLQTPVGLRLDQFNQQHQQTANRRQSPSHAAMDPYASMPGTPRPGPADRYPRSPGSQRGVLDPYAQAPGTPRPCPADPYSQAPGTPRPGSGPESFTPPGSRLSPMSQHPGDPYSHRSPGRMNEPFPRASPSASTPGHTPQHPGIVEDGFSLTQANQTPSHDPFEQGPLTPCPQTAERSANEGTPSTGIPMETQNIMQPQLGDSEEKLRQRQHLRQMLLRQQQQKSAIRQEKGLQEVSAATSSAALGHAPGQATPRHWSQEDATAPPQQQPDLFGRPPPPYPGPMRGGGGPPQTPGGGGRFPGTFLTDQLRPFSSEGPFPRQQFPRDVGAMAAMGVRPQGMRFGFPPGPLGSLQDQQFLRPPHQMPPGGGPVPDILPPQMRRSLSVDFTSRPLGPNSAGPQMGVPQPYPPRGLPVPVQQHNIMGQPFIELRHRAAENRMRLPFGHPGQANMMDPSMQGQRHPANLDPGQRPGQGSMGGLEGHGARMMQPMMGQVHQQPAAAAAAHLQVPANMDNLNQQTDVSMTTGQQQQHHHPQIARPLGHPVTSESLNTAPSGVPTLSGSGPGQTEEAALPGGDGIEEHLDTDDSAVKDLEDVEVKDLVDLNLNLDPEDGKEDLDLGPNDLHLDDFLMSGKFDLIAYTDPELNLEDKKDMFNEELDLGDPMEDTPSSDLQKALAEKRSTGGGGGGLSTSRAQGRPESSDAFGQVKQEVNVAKEALGMLQTEHSIKTEEREGPLLPYEPCSSRSMAKPEGDDGFLSSSPVLSSLLIKEKLEEGLGSAGSPQQQVDQAGGIRTNAGMGMLPGHHNQDHGANPGLPMPHRLNPSLGGPSGGHPNLFPGGNQQIRGFAASAGPMGDLNLPMMGSLQSAPHGLNPQHLGLPPQTQQQHPALLLQAPQPSPRGLNPQTQHTPPHHLNIQGAQTPGLAPQAQPQALFPLGPSQQGSPQPGGPPSQGPLVSGLSPLSRPLLLEEQPLLLQDLLDQERQEQQQQRQMQAMIRQHSSESTFFPNIGEEQIADFDGITDPIMKAKMVALKGINKVMAQSSMGMNPMVINRFQQVPVAPVAPGPDAAPQPPRVLGQDGKLAPQTARPNPPSFGPGFVNEAQRRQYEEWLQETQQLLQMQQKFLEEQIAAHRKSKKALSAKQRTAKKAGRQFPEEDAEQLRHVTEQQTVVQKQLEQIRKQQKEHVELIEEYRTKQQQQQQQQQRTLQPPMMPAMPGIPTGTPPMAQPLMGPIMGPMPPHPGQPSTAHIPSTSNMPGWHQSGGPMAGPGPRVPVHMPPQIPQQMPPQMPQQMPPQMPQQIPQQMPPQMPPATPAPPQPLPQTQTPPSMAPGGAAPPASQGQTGVGGGAGGGTTGGGGGGSGGGGGGNPHVKFDDNNPFSEGFQERERRERLREQQERQRVQLMQEVERHRALQHRLEMEQQGLGMGPALGPGAGAGPGTGVGALAGSGATSTGDGLSQMPFYNADLPPDFLQPPRPPQQQQQQGLQGQPGPMFPQQGGLPPGYGGAGPPPGQSFIQGPGDRRVLPGHRPLDVRPRMNLQLQAQGQGPPSAPGQVRPTGYGGPGMPPQAGAGEGHHHPHPFGVESSSSSSSTPLPPNYPGSGPSLIQLYSDIIPDEKPKKKRNRNRKKKDEDGGGGGGESVRTPSTPRSDVTAPLTPAVSDTSSTPTRSADPSELFQRAGSTPPGLAPSSELERQLAGFESGRSTACDGTLEIKLERMEGGAECRGGPAGPALKHGPRAGGTVKLEEGNEGFASPPPHGPAKEGDAGNELLKHLLKDKQPQTDGQTAAPGEEEGLNNTTPQQGSQVTGSGGDVPEPSAAEPGGKRKPQRNKRAPKTGPDKPPSRYKRRKKEEEEKMVYSSTDTLMTHLKQQLSLLPLMEPVVGVNLALFPPFGSGPLQGDSRLSGSFGNASLDGASDYYSQLIYKQNNLSNPPTPPASLPPTPPPVVRQKMVNGFATTEELARKAAVLGGHDVSRVVLLRQQAAAAAAAGLQTDEDLLTRALSQAHRTVDVPASLPTPPHNNLEELRGQDHSSDRDTPDSFVPSSSPESVVGMEISRYPDLSRVKQERPSRSPSPVIPMMPSAWGKGTEVKQEIKAEPAQLPSCPNAGLVSIAITLNPLAAQNIPGVMAAMADLLCARVPPHYEVTRAPERSSLALLAGVKVPPTQALDPRHPALAPPQLGMRLHRPPGAPTNTVTGARGDYNQHGGASPGPKPQWCCHCRVVVLGNGVRKSTKDLPLKQEVQARAEGSLVFCSHNCSVLYTAALQTKTTDSKQASSSVLQPDENIPESLSRVQHQYSANTSTLDVRCLPQLTLKLSPPSSPPLAFPPAVSAETAGRLPSATTKPESLKVTVKLKPRPRAVHTSGGEESASPSSSVASSSWRSPGPLSKHWRGQRWRRWSLRIVVPQRADASLPDEEEVDELLRRLGESLRPDPLPRDQRRCCFCHEEGDGMTDGPARLLNLDLDLWVHLNCALWSTEVYETQAGALINVELALRRGLAVRCAYCQQMGATSGCHRFRCTNAYHFTCATKAHCTFFKDKTMLCHLHRPRGAGGASAAEKASAAATALQTAGGPASLPGSYDHELRCFAVYRRVYVQRDEARQVASIVQRGNRQHTFRVGSLVFRTVGRLLPQQMAAFHSDAAIFPAGYQASRIYWSMRHGNRRCRYVCSVSERDGRPLFTVKVVEKGYNDLLLTGSTPKAVWDQVLEPVSERRTESGTLQLFPVYLKGEDLFGLTVSPVTRIVESLPGVEACERYRFRYGRNPLMEVPLAFNPTGSARSEAKISTHAKRPYTLTSSGASKSLQAGSVGVVSAVGVAPGLLVLPGETGIGGASHSKQSKSYQYRRMKLEWKSNVYLARSRIQGLGLYAARDIEKNIMVIEYIGSVIRNEVAERKEKMYETQNRGVYMFRIDNEHVIDATISGGPARYINHSCAPNCITEVVTLEKDQKIIISSSRRISRGEELCYDYKFDLEDDQHKIPCHCGGFNCRKWMN